MSVCPNPSKVRFPTKKTAKSALRRHRGTPSRDTICAYRCACGWWHLGHKKGTFHRDLKRRGLA